MFAATAAEFTEFKTLRGRLLILGRHVITAFAVRTLQHNIIARHKSPFRKTKTSTLEINRKLTAIRFLQAIR
jgi:hypothetical protein